MLWNNKFFEIEIDQHSPTNYQAENCWSTLNIPLMYNKVVWNRFLIKKNNKNMENMGLCLCMLSVEILS